MANLWRIYGQISGREKWLPVIFDKKFKIWNGYSFGQKLYTCKKSDFFVSSFCPGDGRSAHINMGAHLPAGLPYVRYSRTHFSRIFELDGGHPDLARKSKLLSGSYRYSYRYQVQYPDSHPYWLVHTCTTDTELFRFGKIKKNCIFVILLV